MKASSLQTRITPKKAALIARLVKNKKATEALDILKFARKRAASILKKVIESAIANATNNLKQNRDNLYIKEIVVTEGPTYKRGIPISRGRMHPILKRTSHINVKLEAKSEVPVIPKTKSKKSKAEEQSIKEPTEKTQ